MAANRYCIDIAKRGTAGCKNCKSKIDKGLVRIAKITANPFSEEAGDMKQWYHARCIFEALSRARATTKKIESPDDIEGWSEIPKENRDEVLKYIEEFSMSGKKTPKKTTPNAKKPATPSAKQKKTSPEISSPVQTLPGPSGVKASSGKDDLFREFRRLCADIANKNKYTEKTAIVSKFFKKGSDGKGFSGDLYLWIKLLLPGVDKRVYNLQSKQLVKLFSDIFGCDQDEMLEDLEQGDVAETVRIFFEDSEMCKPLKKSIITLQEVDQYLEELTSVGKEEQQTRILKKVAKRCTGNDLKTFVRLLKQDLRITAGPKHILEALNPTAYEAFQASRDLKDVVTRCINQKGNDAGSSDLQVKANLMTPVLPMLAEACKKLDMILGRCPNGMLVEIKYDGERVQLHKQGQEFRYFSRSLKPVMPHKVLHFKEFIPKAFPYGNDLILDSEILMVDNEGNPLPFGTLGAHKKTQFKDANVCLFVFDCLRFNDENLMNRPLIERRKILEENMKPIKNHIMFSEMKPVKDLEELKRIMKSVFEQGLEGLIIKDKNSIYEPGKRHWVKVKKDHLKDDSMADTIDLVVLGAYYGTGKKGGMMSTFLMGCYDKNTEKWCTVTKVHGGHDDEKLEELQDEFKNNMVKISKNQSKVPSWLSINKSLLPDFLVKEPKKSQVWEINGAEFTKTENHTADGISIRFPRVVAIRDKTPDDADTIERLKKLFDKSKEKSDMVGLALEGKSDGDEEEAGPSTGKRTKENSLSPSKKKDSNRSTSPVNKKVKSDSDSSSGKKQESKQKKDCHESKTLPCVFSKVKMFLPPTLENVETLRRYFVAYDGILLEDRDKSMSASHVVVTPTVPDRDFLPSAFRVSVDWLWDSIKLQKRMPEKPYLVSP